ncbi:MAG: glycosyltransferase family 4 protein [Planctomycetaceae bacterium]|nr:glycosyltransferase family 4 protein [Planctomycetaceae bacterium]
MSLLQRVPSDRFHYSVVSQNAIPGCQNFPKGIEVRVTGKLSGPFLGRISQYFLLREIEESPPELIDVQHRRMLPTGVWLSRRLGVPYVVTVHDYLRDRETFAVDPTFCRRVIAVSESVRAELLDRTKLSESLVDVIPTGVAVPPDESLCQVLSGERPPVIGTCGPLEPDRGLTDFLQAAAATKTHFPETLYLIAGSGPEEKNLRKLARSLGLADSITFLPNLTEFAPALLAMDIFVLPSLKQGLGSTMLDAMARGIPVIGTESGGVFSVVSHGKTGILVPPQDQTAITDAICGLLADRPHAQKLGEAARIRVSEKFHVDSMVEATCKLYGSILQAEHPTIATS